MKKRTLLAVTLLTLTCLGSQTITSQAATYRGQVIDVQAAAMVRAKECEQLFSHTRPNGSSFATALKEQGVSYRSAGENIAWGQRSPEEVMKAWMNSSGHRLLVSAFYQIKKDTETSSSIISDRQAHLGI